MNVGRREVRYVTNGATDNARVRHGAFRTLIVVYTRLASALVSLSFV